MEAVLKSEVLNYMILDNSSQLMLWEQSIILCFIFGLMMRWIVLCHIKINTLFFFSNFKC